MTRIELMRSIPIMKRNGVSVEVTGRQHELFRLLVLNAGQIVSKESIARLRNTDVDHVASKVRDLRQDLPDWVNASEWIVTVAGQGYKVELGEWSVDAHEFRTTVERITKSAFRPLAQTIQPDEAFRQVAELQLARNMWLANPALGLPVETTLPAAFEALKERAELRLATARLYTRDWDEVREAVQYLADRSRSGDADELTWRLLLLAYDALGSKPQISGTMDRISQAYGGSIPPGLQKTLDEVNGKVTFKNPFTEEVSRFPSAAASTEVSPQPAAESQAAIQQMCDLLGITTASRLRLLDSNLTPVACIRRTRRRLNFSGVFASKWVAEDGVLSEFDQLLSRLDANGGEARFLMINPNGDAFRRLFELRKGQISSGSVERLQSLAAAHPSLKVRAFNSLPSFRIVIVDDDVVSFSPYRLAADVYVATERGWEAPHVVLDPLAPYPLSEAFQLLFNETWNGATPLENI